MDNNDQETYKIEALLQQALGELHAKHDLSIDLDLIEKALEDYIRSGMGDKVDIERWQQYIQHIIDRLNQNRTDLEHTLKNITNLSKPIAAYQKSMAITKGEK